MVIFSLYKRMNCFVQKETIFCTEEYILLYREIKKGKVSLSFSRLYNIKSSFLFSFRFQLHSFFHETNLQMCFIQFFLQLFNCR